MSNFAKSFLSKIKDDYTSLASDGEGAAEYTGTIDTGSYILNAVFSGSLYGGIPNNKITAFAGESATGKTFFVLGIVKSFLDKNEDGIVVYYDTEAAVTKEMMEERGVDTKRVIISEPDTIQKFRTHSISVLDKYLQESESKRPPLMIVLDSLGMLSTSKEMEDTAEGKDTRDMTKAQVIKATFRVLTLRAAKAKVPIVLTNHTYEGMGMFATKEISGGSGLKYAASTIAMLSKKKEKDGTDVIGNIVHVKMYKSRLSKENSMVDVRITYKQGLDKYYGLLDLAGKYNIIKKVSTQYQLPDGSKVYGKEINSNPEKYFTGEVMEKLEEACKKEFLYGEGENSHNNNDETNVQQVSGILRQSRSKKR